MTTYTIYVGNIGTVCTTTVETLAREQFAEWVAVARCPFGRASGEEVVLSADGEPIDEHEPSIIGEPEVSIETSTVEELRAAGWVVVAWTPQEIGEADPDYLEEVATARGNDYLSTESGN